MAENQIPKDKDSQERRSKVWVGEDGIVHVETGRVITEEGVNRIIDEIEEILKKISGEGRILIEIKTISVIRSSRFRKRTADRVRALDKNIGFKKVAVFSETVIMRAIGSFILAASGIKNSKIFTNKKKALDWLKEP